MIKKKGIYVYKKSLNTMHFSSHTNKMVILQHVLKIQRMYIHAFESCTYIWRSEAVQF